MLRKLKRNLMPKREKESSLRQRRLMQFEPLEPRILLSADVAGLEAAREAASQGPEHQGAEVEIIDLNTTPATQSDGLGAQSPSGITIVDTTAPQQTLAQTATDAELSGMMDPNRVSKAATDENWKYLSSASVTQSDDDASTAAGTAAGDALSDLSATDTGLTSEENSAESISNSTQLIIVDASIPDSDALISTITAAGEDQGINYQIILVDSSDSDLDSLISQLDDLEEIDAIHILSHGAAGELQIGETTLSLDTLDSQSDLLTALGNCLGEDGDILLYGCDVADGDSGQALITPACIVDRCGCGCNR